MPKESAETMRRKAQGARKNLKPRVLGLEPVEDPDLSEPQAIPLAGW